LIDQSQWESLFGAAGENSFDFAACSATPSPLAFSLRPEALASCL
jgi:hypothetical protein